jgi:hypothetical protein
MNQHKISKTALGMKPVTFQLVAQCLNQQCYCIFFCTVLINIIYGVKLLMQVMIHVLQKTPVSVLRAEKGNQIKSNVKSAPIISILN